MKTREQPRVETIKLTNSFPIKILSFQPTKPPMNPFETVLHPTSLGVPELSTMTKIHLDTCNEKKNKEQKPTVRSLVQKKTKQNKTKKANYA
mmetsp:Transcript_12191/g.13473  ORF Transcript_12191/g.13473 Transcript_12191/m.13473 type:complete len:92 (+) Transcript_12191:156-431(+)